MKILVQKYGGTSVAGDEARGQVADKVERALRAGWSVVVVVSAIGRAGAPYATDTLLQMLRGVDPSVAPAARESDLLVACGEIISTVVLAQTLHARGIPSIALTGGQAGILTDYEFGNARILSIDPDYVVRMLDAGKVVLVAGFQGVTEFGAITTLGRGGSDTTAAALGAALQPHGTATEVEIYTDVDGVKTADPRIVPGARTLQRAAYHEVAEMAHQGAKVVHPRAAEIAAEHRIPLWVKSTFDDNPGTLITADPGDEDGMRVTGVTHTGRLVHVRFPLDPELDPDRPFLEQAVYRVLQRAGIAIHLADTHPGSFSFAIGREHLGALRDHLDGLAVPVDLGVRRQPPFGRIHLLGIGTGGRGFASQSELLARAGGFVHIVPCQARLTENTTVVSVIASGFEGLPGIMARMLVALDHAGVPVHQTADSTYSLSALVPETDAPRAIRALHEEFGLGGEPR
ncbi:MAG: aspartate kinase [Armatimonadota bacterium]